MLCCTFAHHILCCILKIIQLVLPICTTYLLLQILWYILSAAHLCCPFVLPILCCTGFMEVFAADNQTVQCWYNQLLLCSKCSFFIQPTVARYWWYEATGAALLQTAVQQNTTYFAIQHHYQYYIKCKVQKNIIQN